MLMKKNIDNLENHRNDWKKNHESLLYSSFQIFILI